MTFLPIRLARAVLAGIGTTYETLIPGPNIHGYRLDAAEMLAEAEAEQEVSEPECNCTAFGDPEFDAEYCSLHNQQTVHVAGLDITRASLDELGASLQHITDAEKYAFRSANNRLIRDALGPYAAPEPPPAPVAGQRGENPAGGTPPTPAGSPDPSPTSPPASQPPVRGEGSPADSDIPPSPAGERPTWIDWAVPAICDVLADHTAVRDGGAIMCSCQSASDPLFGDWQDWREYHAAPLIAERLKAAMESDALRTYAAPEFETGLDMGASMASEFFLQHRREPK